MVIHEVNGTVCHTPAVGASLPNNYRILTTSDSNTLSRFCIYVLRNKGLVAHIENMDKSGLLPIGAHTTSQATTIVVGHSQAIV